MKHEGKNKKRVRNGGENMKFEAMFQPIQIGPMTVANRFVMSPMGNNFANTDGTMSERSASYYGARAKGGFGLITFEATVVYKEAKGGPRKPCLYDDSTVSSFQAAHRGLSPGRREGFHPAAARRPRRQYKNHRLPSEGSKCYPCLLRQRNTRSHYKGRALSPD